MKKIMFALAIAAVAVVSQGASLKWTTSANLAGVAVGSVGDNGTYTSESGSLLKGNGALTFIFEVYSGTTKIGSYSGDVKYGTTNKKVTTSFTVAEAAQGTTYDYVLKISGTQGDLTSKTSDGYDYSAAQIAAELTGSFTTLASGVTTVTTGVPASWDVSGVVTKEQPDPGPIPEPTSGLLLLVGGALLGLRRRRA